jgi:hypothetical protein
LLKGKRGGQHDSDTGLAPSHSPVQLPARVTPVISLAQDPPSRECERVRAPKSTESTPGGREHEVTKPADNQTADPRKADPPLTPGNTVLSSHTSNHIRSLPSLHLADTAERQKPAQSTEIPDHRPAPPQCVEYQGRHGQCEDRWLEVGKQEDTRHEQLEGDEGPEETVEGDSPGLAVGFVWLEVD